MAPAAEPRRFLLVGHNAGGTVPPMLALAQEMVRRGHDVTWLSQPSVRERAVAAGCRFEPLVGSRRLRPGIAIEEQLELAMVGIGRTRDRRAAHRAGRSSSTSTRWWSTATWPARSRRPRALDAPSAVLFHSMFKTFSDVWFGELWPLLAPAVNDARRAFGVAPADSWNETFAGHDRLISVVPAAFDAPVADAPDPLRHFGFLVPDAVRPSPPFAGFPDGDGPTRAGQPLDHVSATGGSARPRRRCARRTRGAWTRHDRRSRRRGHARRAGPRDGLRLRRPRPGAPRDRRR